MRLGQIKTGFNSVEKYAETLLRVTRPNCISVSFGERTISGKWSMTFQPQKAFYLVPFPTYRLKHGGNHEISVTQPGFYFKQQIPIAPLYLYATVRVCCKHCD